jgi:acyl-CoA synthetase (AMP-forming)/AMP-acid ligase II
MSDSSHENLTDAIFRYAEERPNAPALIEGGTTVGYGELAFLVGGAMRYLLGLGVNPGDRIAVAMDNGIDHLVLAFALLRLGAVLIEVPPSRPAGYRTQAAAQFGIRFFLVEASVEPPLPIAPTVVVPFGWRRTLTVSGDDRRRDGGAAPAALLLSSGSTGTPSGVLRSHAFLLHHCRHEAAIAVTGVISPDRPCPVLLPLPISYAGFLGAALAAILAGCSLVFVARFTDGGELARLVASWGDAVLPTTPDICRSFVDQAPAGERLLPELRALMSMGQPLFADDKRAIVERVTPNLYDTFGAVGIGVVGILRPHEMLTKGRTVGRPAAGVEIEIVDAAGHPVPDGTLGRFRARRRLAEQDEPDAGAPPAWTYTGDIARLDEDGYLELRGRATEIVTRRGIEIYPGEVEAALIGHPAIRDAAVVGLSAVGTGDNGLIAVVVRAGLVEPETLDRHCAATLPAEKRPDAFVFLNALPRLGTGKLDRARVRTLAAEALTNFSA